jgi:hypothetical protein
MVIAASTTFGIGFVFLFLMLEDLGLCLSCVALFLGVCKEWNEGDAQYKMAIWRQ